ncbi:SRPBCC family protein [Micromonospora sp. NPDC048930]|uniref:SRPBCC family protein n=1 Tax=Micromonospora sp. NPDC048930 TaxID=3364261 RepID=UPI0037124671
MRTITTEIEIEAAPAAVWAVLTDVAAYPEWNPFLREATGRLAVGERPTFRAHPPGSSPFSLKPRVLAMTPPHELRWIGRLLMPGVFDGEHTFTLTATSDGHTRLVQAERFTGILVPFTGRLLNNTQAGFVALNEALKKRVEGLTTARG